MKLLALCLIIQTYYCQSCFQQTKAPVGLTSSGTAFSDMNILESTNITAQSHVKRIDFCFREGTTTLLQGLRAYLSGTEALSAVGNTAEC